MPIVLKALAESCAATIKGGDPATVIHSAADIMSAQAGQVTQLTSPRYGRHIQTSAASACFVAADAVVGPIPDTLALLVCADPEMAFIKAVELLHPQPSPPAGIAPQAVVAATAVISGTAHVGPYAVIGEHARVGEHSQVFAGVVIGDHVNIGAHCRIHPHAVIYAHCLIGDHVTIHAGAVIGADGFGYKFRGQRHVKVPQVGHVVIGDHVEIGANTCVDRGALGSTRIGAGSKIDNLVQIGHNNQIGRHAILCGQVGVSGSCQIGDYAVLAGSAGIADHVSIGDGAVVMARAGVAGDIPVGQQVFGSPAKDKKTAYKELAALARLPELLKTVNRLSEQVRQLAKLAGQ